MADAINKLKSHASKAVDTLVALLNDESSQIKRGAANDILNHVIKFKELQEIEAMFSNKRSCHILLRMVQNNQTLANIRVSKKALTISPCDSNQSEYQINVDATPCNYGHWRYWFNCPTCQRKCQKLYLTQQYFFRCRECLNLGYLSQLYEPLSRYSIMIEKIDKKLKDLGDDRRNKPKGMHKHTFEKLRSKIWDYEIKSEQEMDNILI